MLRKLQELYPYLITVKPSTFGPTDLMETLDHFLPALWLLQVDHVPKMNRTEFANLNSFHNFHFLHFL